jgi:hypothetical protein
MKPSSHQSHDLFIGQGGPDLNIEQDKNFTAG